MGVLIFAFGVLGLMGLQATMSRAQSQAKERAEAVILANDLFAQIQTDAPSKMGSYDSAKCAAYSKCKEWQSRVSATLPAGAGSAAVDVTTGMIVVTLNWSQPGDQLGKATHSYVTSMQWS